jgi:hypothetical protein
VVFFISRRKNMNGATEVTVKVNGANFDAFIKNGKVYATKRCTQTTHLVSETIMSDERILKMCIRNSFYTKW